MKNINNIKNRIEKENVKFYDVGLPKDVLINGIDLFSIDNFIDYLDQLVNLNNPKITILVGNKSENYDHLSENIETVFNDKIYRGIKIIYRNKVYDLSLSERNV